MNIANEFGNVNLKSISNLNSTTDSSLMRVATEFSNFQTFENLTASKVKLTS